MQTTRAIDSLAPRYRHVFARAAIREAASMSEFLALVRREQEEHPDVTVFVTLDDLDQALYTSMHATESDTLEIDTDDLDFLGDPAADEVFQRRQFSHTVSQLGNPELRVAWTALHATREGGADEIDVLPTVNDRPVDILDDLILLLHVPVPADDPTVAIAAVPNGYFSDDWNVFENHAVARHLADGYGYRPLGIGASWIGFIRPEPLSPEEAERLVAELIAVYGAAKATGWGRLRGVLTREPTLFLGYTENFAE